MTVVTALVVLVDAAAGDRGPAALLPTGPAGGGEPATVLRRLLSQAPALGLAPAAVLTRRDWLDRARGEAAAAVPVVPYEGRAGVLASIATQLDRLRGPVVLAHGDVLVSTDALADVVADTRLGTAVLTGTSAQGFLRVAEGRVVAAGSAAHTLAGPTSAGLGVLRVAEADRVALAQAARELAGLVTVHGWESDPLDLLVLAAVRRGLVVTEVPIGGYVWARPYTAEAARRAAQRADALDDHRVRLERVARPDDGFYSTFVVRRLSRLVTDRLVRAPALRALTPNAVTVAALAVALVAAGAFATGERAGLVAGALLLQVSLVLDCVDGELARYRRTFSAFGAWLDLTTDRVKEYVVYAALAFGASRAGEDAWTLAAATLALQVFRNFVDFGFVATVTARRAALRGELLPLDFTADPDSPDVRRSGAYSDQVSGRNDPVAAGSAAAASGTAGLGRGAVALSVRTSGNPALRWGKRMMFLPIGERWLIISVAAALSGPRAVFAVLLGLGVVSALYATAGRVLRTLAGTAMPDVRAELADLADLGPPARVGVAAVAGRFGWLLPGVLRGLEYGLVVLVVTAGGAGAMPAAFAYLAALAYHHYDTVYRWRHTGHGPARWVAMAALGVPARLVLLAVVLALPGDPTAALAAGAAALGVLFLAESGAGWRAWFAARTPSAAAEDALVARAD